MCIFLCVSIYFYILYPSVVYIMNIYVHDDIHSSNLGLHGSFQTSLVCLERPIPTVKNVTSTICHPFTHFTPVYVYYSGNNSSSTPSSEGTLSTLLQWV